MSRYIRIQGVRKSRIIPPDIKSEYEKDAEQFLKEQIDYMEEEIVDEINGLILERDFLKIVLT